MLINPKNQAHIVRGLELLHQQLMEGQGKPLSNYSPELAAELNELIIAVKAYKEMPLTFISFEAEGDRIGVQVGRTEGVGSEAEQAYVKAVADSLNQSLDLIIPPDNVGFAILRIEDTGNDLQFSPLGICGAEEGKFRTAVEKCTRMMLDVITGKLKK